MIWQGAAVEPIIAGKPWNWAPPPPRPPERAAALTSVSENFLTNGEQTGLTLGASWTKEAPAASPSRGGQERLLKAQDAALSFSALPRSVKPETPPRLLG